MTDKEMIEEVAHELYSKQDEYDMSNPFEVAKCICDLGYCKPREGSVVLTIEEVDEFRKDSAEVKFLKNKIIEQSRKETAKEILRTIWEELGIDILSQCYTIPVRTFNKIKRQFGVEVEE